MEDYLTFRKMITPIIIQIIFWIGAVGAVLWALFLIFSGATTSYAGGRLVLTGLIALFLGPILVRIYCELLILLFRINDTLNEIKASLETKK